jgi:RecB family endonuclease NucS
VKPNLLAYPSLLKGESSFREFIANNLDLIEPGLAPYPDPEHCQEVDCPYGDQRQAGKIDVLATDPEGALVVIECKIKAGPPALGQLIGYMAWARRRLAKHDQQVRGLIVALDVTTFLALALRYIKDVPIEVVRYSTFGSVRIT